MRKFHSDRQSISVTVATHCHTCLLTRCNRRVEEGRLTVTPSRKHRINYNIMHLCVFHFPLRVWITGCCVVLMLRSAALSRLPLRRLCRLFALDRSWICFLQREKTNVRKAAWVSGRPGVVSVSHLPLRDASCAVVSLQQSEHLHLHMSHCLFVFRTDLYLQTGRSRDGGVCTGGEMKGVRDVRRIYVH